MEKIIFQTSYQPFARFLILVAMLISMTNTLLGIFSNRLSAENAISELESQGFNPKDISLIMRNQQTGETVTHHGGTNVAEGAVSGAATGGLMGGIAGLLIGIGAITLPGIGAILIAGPLAAALGLTGVAATTAAGAMTGAVAGGLVGSLIGLGVPEEEAKVIEGRIRDGGILVAVPVLIEEEAKVRKIFHQFGADMVRAISAQDREREIYDREANYNQHQNYQAYEQEVDMPRENATSRVEEYQHTAPAYSNRTNSAYYSEVRPERRYERNLDDLAARDEYGQDRRSFWQKLKDLFH